uniref:Uncharacterized protein n=1 Tax=Romanomermis culicivorax TaxID=13658 RepID=A0A915KRK7_ROMCU
MDASIFVDKSQKSGKEEEIILKPSECSYVPFKYESPLIDLQKFKAQVALDSRIKSLQEINRMIDVKFIIKMNDDDHLLQNLTNQLVKKYIITFTVALFFFVDFIRQVLNSRLSVKVTDPTVVVDLARLPDSSLCELHLK